MEHVQSAIGLLVLIAIAWTMSENRRHPGHIKVAIVGVAVQLSLGALLLTVHPIADALDFINQFVHAMLQATEAGTSFVFGYLGGGPLPFEANYPGAVFIFAFRALPLILVISALSALLTYWRVLPLVVRGFAFVLQRTLGVGGAVGLSAAANIFIGMVESPLLVRPYLARLSRAELFIVMTVGMATVAGTMFVLYATILEPKIPNVATHLVIASLISAPAAITIAKLMIPEQPDAELTHGDIQVDADTNSAMDAITKGTANGLAILLNVIAMLIVLVALVYLVNTALGFFPELSGAPLTLERMFGWVMAPLVWLMGVPWSEAATAGGLMGVKTVLNELLAYIQLSNLPDDALAPRSRLIMIYALCGFANFGSLGILIAGITTMVPERKSEVVELGMKSIVAGTLATSCTGAIVGIF